MVGALGRTLDEIYPGADEVVGGTAASGAERLSLPASQACTDVATSFDPSIEVVPIPDTPDGGREWFRAVGDTCSVFSLFTLIATAAGPELTPDTFADAVSTLGELELPFVYDASLGAEKWDADNALRLSRFDPDLGVAGGPASITELVTVD